MYSSGMVSGNQSTHQQQQQQQQQVQQQQNQPQQPPPPQSQAQQQPQQSPLPLPPQTQQQSQQTKQDTLQSNQVIQIAQQQQLLSSSSSSPSSSLQTQSQVNSNQLGINGNNNPSNNNAGTNNGGNHGSNAGLIGGGTSAAAAKNQLEQLNTMREALFSQDGWGCQHVNQDTNWDVPGSPEPANKDPTGGPPMWKPNINNGTDLWEANLRNGGQPPPQPVQKTPWGHTPTSNLGGTWGEDDDGNDANNVWTGAPTNPGASGGSGSVVATGGTSSGGPQGWGAQGANTAGGANAGSAPTNAWGDPRDMRPTTLDIRNVDPRDLRTPSSDPRSDLRNTGNIIDPREQIRDLRGDPRGISGRLNGTSAEMWGQHHALAAAAAQGGHLPLNKMVGPGGTGNNGGVINPNNVPGSGVGSGNTTSQWNTSTIGGVNAGGVPKDITMTAATVVGSKLSTGWGEEPSPPPQRRNLQNYDDGTSLWGQQSRVPGSGVGGGSHWKDINDPMSRSHLLRGTIGGGQNSGGAGNQGNVGGPMQGQGRSGVPAGSGGLIGAAGTGGQLKPDNMWGHSAGGGNRNNGAWGDDQHVGGTANWGDIDKTNMGNLGGNAAGGVGGGWNDATATNAWNKNQNKLNSGVVSGGGGGNTGGGQVGGWPDPSDIGTEWGSIPQHAGVSKSQVMNLKSNENILRTSKAYRVLTEMGFKKEDVEMALRATNSNIDEAMEILTTRQNMDGWRRHDDTPSNVGNSGINASGFDHGGNGFSSGRFPSGPPTTMPFQPVQKYLNQQGPHNVAGALAAAQQQQQQQQFNSSGGPGNLGGATPSNAGGSHQSGPPSAHQLRMLVQQIQMAVQGGYLSNQILNQPLAPTTLILLNQLLSNIKHLQGAQTSIQRNPSINNNLQLTLAITKYKQTIQNLQNQINAQQAIYIKQQQQQQQQQQLVVAQQNQQAVAAAAAAAAAAASVVSHSGGGNVGVTGNSASVGSSSDYMRGQHDAISALQGNFSEINLKDQSGAFQGAPNQQSRLNQWKLPVLEKDVPSDSTDFSRAPGPTAKSISTNSTNINTLGLQNDGAWSSARIGDGWPDSSNDNENKDWPAAQQSPATAFTDLVPEFEPGKPWKGSQIKSIEDDPSITPGSVARSPLSINPTPKEADLFANSSKASPTDLPPLSLSSSTWSFNPSGNQQNFTSWSDNVPQQSAATSELWAAPQLNKTSRGPPPGLGANKSVGSSNCNNNGTGSNNSNSNNPSNSGNANGSNANGWIGAALSVRGAPNNQSSWSGANSNWNSTWLLLKNLTTQIDGSTLRTLCMQHGPLINFHLYLNQGIALCKYATREEANKAQMALNNCVLSTTTICAESPNDSEVQNILQHLPANNSNGSGPNGGQSQATGGGNANSSNVNAGGPVNSNNGSGSANSQSAWRSQNQQNQSRPPGADAWSGTVWQPNASSNLWTSQLDGSTERGTPSNLRSLLPGDLLELN